MPRSHRSSTANIGAQRSPLLILYLALIILGRRGLSIFRRDVRALSRLSRNLQGQVFIRLWLLGPYYTVLKKYLIKQTVLNKPTMASSKRNVQHALQNYKAYSGIFALLGSAGSSSGASSFWPFGGGSTSEKSRNGSRSRANSGLEDVSSGSLSPIPGLTLQCPTCVQRELEEALEEEFAAMEPDEPAPMTYVPKVLTAFPAKTAVIDKRNASIRDIPLGTDSKSPLTAGFLKLEPGRPLTRKHAHNGTTIIMSGSFDITDATGQKVHAVVGDVFYFPKGSDTTFSTKEGGVAFYTTQKGDGETRSRLPLRT